MSRFNSLTVSHLKRIIELRFIKTKKRKGKKCLAQSINYALVVANHSMEGPMQKLVQQNAASVFSVPEFYIAMR